MKNIFLFLYPLVSWGGMLLSSLCIVLIIHVVPFLVDFLFVLEFSLSRVLVQKCCYEKVCSSGLIHTSLLWCLKGF